jgi:molecular chaperone DnaK (HSP70)
MSNTDLLTEDTINPPGQQFICISFLTDKDNKTTLSGIKIRGAFPTYDAACEHAKKLQGVDNYFNVFVGEMGKWLPFDPNPDSEAVKNSEYANEQLNTMMKAYMENQEKAKIYHEQRKNEMVRKNILDNLTTRQENLNDIKKKLKKSKNPQEKNNLEKSLEEIEKQIAKMEEKKTELDGQIDSLGNQLKGFGQMKLDPPNILINDMNDTNNTNDTNDTNPTNNTNDTNNEN